MPYVIGIIVLVVVGVAFTLLQSSNETEVAVEEVREVEPPTTEDTVAAGTEQQNLPTEILDESDPAVSQIIDNGEATEPATVHADGTYTTQVSYFTPRRTEHVMDVTLTLENNVVTEAEILWDGEVEPKTPNHISFDEAYEAMVVGQPIEEVFLSRVGGASLTSDSFNDAIEDVMKQAS